MTDPYQIPIEELQQELVDMQQRNEEMAVKLGQENVGVNPYLILSLRLDALLDSILDERNRILYEIRYEQDFFRLLEKMQENSNRARLLQPMRQQTGGGGLIVP